MFWNRKKKTETLPFDPKTQSVVLRCSICTGEQTLCFRDLESGRLHEYVLINSRAELEEYKKKFGVAEIPEVY